MTQSDFTYLEIQKIKNGLFQFKSRYRYTKMYLVCGRLRGCVHYLEWAQWDTCILPEICHFWVQNVKLGKNRPCHFNGLEKTQLEPKFEVSSSKDKNLAQLCTYSPEGLKDSPFTSVFKGKTMLTDSLIVFITPYQQCLAMCSKMQFEAQTSLNVYCHNY